MSADADQRVEDLFHQARSLSGPERDRFLDRNCADEPELRRTVEALLAELAEDPEFLAQPLTRWTASRRLEEQRHAASDAELPFDSLGEFRLVRKLGEGGMGTVYLAEQPSLNREVALKLIRPERAGSREARERFLREARSAARLRHPNVVGVYAVGEAEGVPYIAMELIEGKSLDELLRLAASRGAQQQVAEVLAWAAQLADALAFAHQNGIVHRDVKPSNVHVGDDGLVRLLDFGIARNLDLTRLTLTGEFRGTPSYASPEQIRGAPDQLDEKTDVYSLGVTVYEALAGRLPFVGETTEQVFHKILETDPIPLRHLNSSVPRDLHTVVLTAMAKEPDRRYANMEEFAEDLRNVGAGRPIRARPPGPMRRLTTFARRRPGVAAACSVAVLSLVGFFLYHTLYSWPRILEEKNRAMREAESAERERQKVLRVSDVKVLQDLLEEMDNLWPCVPEQVEAMSHWLDRAQELLDRRAEHEASLAELLARSEGRRGNGFLAEREAAWWEDTLQDLLAGLEAIAAEDRYGGTILNMRKRLEFAEQIEKLSITYYSDEWQETIESIQDEISWPQYRGLVIRPQIGLVPLGPDPDSDLFEFWHVQTGKMPVRDEQEKLVLAPESGLVFVLLPGGRFTMGAQKDDPDAPHFDPLAEWNEAQTDGRLFEVDVGPFFISKYEMTQVQWERFMGENPSYLSYPVTRWELGPTHPVEMITWSMSRTVARRFGMRLPEEADWEYACRAGTDTVFHTGDDGKSLAGYANIADEGSKGWFLSNWSYEAGFSDGYHFHAPVGSFGANGFGLHDMHGNVWEWCLDVFHDYMRIPDGSRPVSTEEAMEVPIRGGSFDGPSTSARSSNRLRSLRGFAARNIGLRLTRRIDR